jgi:hypothetical protein
MRKARTFDRLDEEQINVAVEFGREFRSVRHDRRRGVASIDRDEHAPEHTEPLLRIYCSIVGRLPGALQPWAERASASGWAAFVEPWGR